MTKKKESVTTPRHVDRLYKAVLNYVKKHGGKVDSISGVQIQDFANGIDFNVIVRCAGTMPEFAKPKPPTPEQVRSARQSNVENKQISPSEREKLNGRASENKEVRRGLR